MKWIILFSILWAEVCPIYPEYPDPHMKTEHLQLLGFTSFA